MSSIEILKKVRLGDGVAENEQAELENYFVATEAWQMLLDGRVDIIYGAKGTGKSALYLLLMKRAAELARRDISVLAGEEVSADPVFKAVNDGVRLNESQFRDLWKVYILTLIGNDLVKKNLEKDLGFNAVINLLREEGYIPLDTLRKVFRNAFDRIIKGSLEIAEPATGNKYKITLGDTSTEEEAAGKISVRDLLETIDKALVEADMQIWISFDRLDVAFTDPEIETNALRALFRVYRDFAGFEGIKLKIFLRDDIWERITKVAGFREQSHITRYYTIKWLPDAIRHLILMRFYNNPAIEQFTSLSKSMLQNDKVQESAFYSIFPDQVESGPKKSKTFDWILKRVQDGKQNIAPREVINLIRFAREQQIQIEETGASGNSPSGCLLSPNALVRALAEVSKSRIQTIWSEYPELRNLIEGFKGAKTEHNTETISEIIKKTTSGGQPDELIAKLLEIGFIQEKKGGGFTTYWVPFIFRPFLSMSQGSAFNREPGAEAEDD